MAGLAAVLVLSGCATRIPLQVQRTPTLNTSGIQRVAVMPFDGRYFGVAQYATNVAASKIQETGNFTLISPAVIGPRRRAGQDFADLVDALFIGEITRIGEESGSRTGERTVKNKDGSERTETYITYYRNVEVEFTYSLVRARDGAVIGPVTRRGATGASSGESGRLASAEALARRIVDVQMATLYRDIVPYTLTVRRVMAKETNKALQPQMESALAQVKAGNYKIARDAYLAIYENSKSMAAAENASVILEALGETQVAADLMGRIFDETGNPKAKNILARLNKELQESAMVDEYQDTQKDARSPAEKAAEVASAEVQNHLSGNARVWIINNSSAENVLANNVIDNITAALIRRGITVVDRQNTELILEEQKFQMSGHVNDADIVRAGNLAGVNNVIMVSVLGAGAMRRLQVRVIDVQRGTVVMQSDTGDRWSL
jgi:TolB-like protein